MFPYRPTRHLRRYAGGCSPMVVAKPTPTGSQTFLTLMRAARQGGLPVHAHSPGTRAKAEQRGDPRRWTVRQPRQHGLRIVQPRSLFQPVGRCPMARRLLTAQCMECASSFARSLRRSSKPRCRECRRRLPALEPRRGRPQQCASQPLPGMYPPRSGPSIPPRPTRARRRMFPWSQIRTPPHLAAASQGTPHGPPLTIAIPAVFLRAEIGTGIRTRRTRRRAPGVSSEELATPCQLVPQW